MSAHFVLGGRVQIDREEQRSLSSICFLSSSSSCPVCQAVPNFTGWTSKAHFSRRRPKLGHSFCYSSTVFLSSVRHSVSTCNVLSPSLVRHIFHGEDTSLVSLSDIRQLFSFPLSFCVNVQRSLGFFSKAHFSRRRHKPGHSFCHSFIVCRVMKSAL